jgi:hypothetical protein
VHEAREWEEQKHRQAEEDVQLVDRVERPDQVRVGLQGDNALDRKSVV